LDVVTVFLRGGLGNQMFQYALGLNLAKKNQCPLVLDTVFLRDRFPRRNFTYRTYDMDVFAIDASFTVLSYAANSFPIPGAWLGLDMVGILGRRVFGSQTLIRENTKVFDPSVLAAQGDILLYGRWQNEEYFADIADDVLTAFKFRYPLEGAAETLAEKIIAVDSVSLHVRRGDYVTFKNVEQRMGATDIAYYDRAAKYIGERVTTPHFFIFSDDIQWCETNVAIPFPTTYVDDTSSGPKAAFHLELMSLCKHNVIANSTFSWWGAWLNKNSGKIVIAPKKWYTNPSLNKNTVPAGWIKI
jgi:hypothetical protein